MPPFALIRDFLTEEEADGLLDWAIANETRFTPTVIGHKTWARVDLSHRRSLGIRQFGQAETTLRKRVTARAPELIALVKMSPVEFQSVELELVAHGDGAYYRKHIDTFTAADGGDGKVRILSAVYYAFVRPKAFSGGALRLHAFGSTDVDEAWVDIEPEHNALVAFPSWAPHEVRPVSCPSERFSDSRFAVNIWLRTYREPDPSPEE